MIVFAEIDIYRQLNKREHRLPGYDNSSCFVLKVELKREILIKLCVTGRLFSVNIMTMMAFWKESANDNEMFENGFEINLKAGQSYQYHRNKWTST